MKGKRGDIWVSAVLYFGLGIVIITILLTAGLPVINKLRDKNIAIQTKNSFQILDTNIRDVIRGGPGTQRIVTLDLKRGDFKIDQIDDKITWKFDSKVFLTEPVEDCGISGAISVTEGNVIVCTEKAATEGSYKVIMKMEYAVLADIDSVDVSGIGDISIRNDGVTDDKIKVTISQV